jgi:hypothetical protein
MISNETFDIFGIQKLLLFIQSSPDQKTKTIVYRGQGLPLFNFETLQKLQGYLLSFNYFLSKSIDQQISWMFADSAPQNTD